MDSYTEIKKYKMLVESAVTQPMTDHNAVDETDMEEGNEFSGARAAAIKAGQDTFTVDGKTYHVTGDKEVDETESQDWNDLTTEAAGDLDSQWSNTETVAETDVTEGTAHVDPVLQRLRELSGMNS